MGSLSGSKSKSSSQQSSFGQSFIDPLQQAFRGPLFSQALGLQQSQQGNIGQFAGELGGGLLGAGFGQLGGVGQAAQGAGGFQPGIGQTFQAAQGLGQIGGQGQGLDPASQALSQQAFGQNANLESQIGQLGSDITRQFNQGILPGIQSAAVGAGQLGGGRQGVAQGLGIQASQDAFARGAGQLRSDDIGRQLQAAQSLGGLQSQQLGQQIQALQGQGQLGLGQQGQQLAGQLGQGQLNLGGLESLQGLFNLGLSPFQAEFQPLQNLASILGPGNILNQTSSQASSRSKSGSFGIGVG